MIESKKGWEEGPELTEEGHSGSGTLPGGQGACQGLGESSSDVAINRDALGGIAKVSGGCDDVSRDGGGRVVSGAQSPGGHRVVQEEMSQGREEGGRAQE